MFISLSVVFIAEAAQVIILPVLPSISHELFLHPDKSQYLLVVFFVGSITGTLILGNLANLLGVHKVLCLSILTLLIGNLMFCIGMQPLHLLIARFLIGIGCGGALSLVGAIVISTFNKNTHMRIFGIFSAILNTERFFAICYIIMIISSVTSPIFSSHVLALAGWRTSIWVLTAVNTILLLYILLGDTKKHINNPKSLGANIVYKKLQGLLKLPFFLANHYISIFINSCTNSVCGNVSSSIYTSVWVIPTKICLFFINSFNQRVTWLLGGSEN